MKDTKPGKRHLMGLPFFDILANFKYCGMFEYQPYFKYQKEETSKSLGASMKI